MFRRVWGGANVVLNLKTVVEVFSKRLANNIEMNPSKSERKSRRSSILKAPKPRHPLQNVELNASSAENSPSMTTAKFKRRVSFAEKKHVKEFCDSLEQGTVWDNTYEESELSQMRNSQNSNNDENIVNNDAPNNLSKNVTKICTKSIDKLEIIDSNETRKKSQISIVTESAVSSTRSVHTKNTKVVVGFEVSSTVERESSKTNVHEKPSGIPLPGNYPGSYNLRRSRSITKDVLETYSTKKQPLLAEIGDSCTSESCDTGIAPGSRNSVNFGLSVMPDVDCNQVPMEETLVGEDLLMETTNTIPCTALLIDRSLPKSSLDGIINVTASKNHSNSGVLPLRKMLTSSEEKTRVDETENGEETIGPTESGLVPPICPRDQGGTSTLAVHLDTSTVLTEALSNRMATGARHDEIVTTFLDVASTESAELEQNKIKIPPTKTTTLNDKFVDCRIKSMGLTAAVRSIPSNLNSPKPLSEKTTVCSDQTGEITKIQPNESTKKTLSAKTTTFHDQSMDVTNVVRNGSNYANLQKIPSEKTTIFHDQSIDMAEVVRSGLTYADQLRNLPDRASLFDNEKQFSEKTAIFHDQSMDMTNVVRTGPSCVNLQKAPPEITTIFHNQSIDMTEAVRSGLTYADQLRNLPDRASLFDNEKQFSEKTAIFHDQSMDMTNVVRNGPSCANLQRTPSEKTTIFHNQSIDMTEAVRSGLTYADQLKNLPDRASLFDNQSAVVRSSGNNEKPFSEKTAIFHDQSMDMTNVVRNGPSCANLQRTPFEKTTIFHNQSIDMTEAVRSGLTYADQLRNLPDRASLFDNQSAVVRSSGNNEKPFSEKTEIFHDQSMDMTNVVRNGPSCADLQKAPSEKTTIFHNQSIDMTEAVRSGLTYADQLRNLEDRASLFDNQSAVVCSSGNNEKPFSEKTTIFHDQSMDMTNVDPNGPSCADLQKARSEKTTIFHNQSIDMTEVVRSRLTYAEQLKNLPDRASVFNNQSVVVRSSGNNEKQTTNKTAIFHDQSMDITSVVRNGRICENLQKVLPEKTTIYDNQSVDTTEPVRSTSSDEDPQNIGSEKNTLLNSQSLDMARVGCDHLKDERLFPEKTTIFQNQSVDMTEVVQSISADGNPQKYPKDKTIIFQDQIVNMTEAVQFNAAMDKSHIAKPDRTTMIFEKSVITTETISKELNIQNSIQQDHQRVMPSIIQRPSVLRISSAAPTDDDNEGENEQLGNRSPECTDNVPQNPGLSKLLSRDSCTLAVERRAKHKLLDVKEANGLIANINVPKQDLVVRSPEPKRVRSLGTRRSIDVTAAVPFVVYRKAVRRRCDDNETVDGHPRSSEVNFGVPPNTEVCGNKSVGTMEEAADSLVVDPSGTLPDRPVEGVGQESHDNTMNSQTEIPMDSMQTFPRQSIRSRTADPSRNNGFPRLHRTACFDDSMEITGPIPGILKSMGTMFNDESMNLTGSVSPVARIRSVINESGERAVRSPFGGSSAFEDGTMVYRDELMEVTKPIEQNRKQAEEEETLSSNNVRNSEIVGRTMIYCDDSMELTGVVPFPSGIQTAGVGKENCPMATNDLRPRSYESPDVKNRLGVSKSEWLQMIGSVPFLSSRKNIENPVKPIESIERASGTEMEEITGVEPFVAQTRGDNEGEYDLERIEVVNDLRSEKLEMTDATRRSLGKGAVNPEHSGHNMERRLQSSEMETGRPVEGIQYGQQQVVKQLFQRPNTSQRSNTAEENPAKNTVTTDLDAEIRKLAKSFALSNSVDESGFDQATFLRQQARCMEDYEANSEASQEYLSAAMSSRKAASFPEKRSSPDSRRSDGPKASATNEKPGSPRTDWPVSSTSKTDIPISSETNLVSENNRSSGVDRTHYDKSLEELRCRAHSVREFRPDETCFELTAAISMGDREKGHESIFAQEPPSFVFSDSITMDIIPQSDSSVHQLPVEMNFSITEEMIEAPKSPKLSRMSIHGWTQTAFDSGNNNSDLENTADIAEVTMAIEEKTESGASVQKDQNPVEQSDAEHRRHTFVKKRNYADAATQTSFPPETDEGLKGERLTGATTAAKFSSESPDGPNEKIRRRENESANQRKSFPTVYEENKPMDSMKSSRLCGKRHFSDSEVVEKGLAEPFGPPSIGDTSTVGKPDKTTSDFEFSSAESAFAILKTTLEGLAKRPGTIWEINRLDERIVVFHFSAKSIALVVCLNKSGNFNSPKPIKAIDVQSQLVKESTEPGVRLAHSLIMKKIDSLRLMECYTTYDDVPCLLEFVSTEVKSGMDFLAELENLRRRTIIDIHADSLTFLVRTRDIDAGIILNITIEMKPFEEITPNDVTVFYLLGEEKVREDEIKKLMTNVKMDHTFLRSYINDVKDYIDLMGLNPVPIGEDSF